MYLVLLAHLILNLKKFISTYNVIMKSLLLIILALSSALFAYVMAYPKYYIDEGMLYYSSPEWNKEIIFSANAQDAEAFISGKWKKMEGTSRFQNGFLGFFKEKETYLLWGFLCSR